MYCTRCGKKIDYDSFVCNECRAAEEALVNQSNEPVAEPAPEVKVESETVAPETAQPAAAPVEEPKTETANPTPTNPQYYYSAQSTSYAQYQAPQNAQPVNAPVGNPRMIGFGKALASAILSVVGYIFALVAFFVAAEGAVSSGLVLFMMTLGMVIPALILGIQSIKTSARVASQNLPRPIPTLVLGIVGAAFSGLSLFYCFLTFIMLGVA